MTSSPDYCRVLKWKGRWIKSTTSHVRLRRLIGGFASISHFFGLTAKTSFTEALSHKSLYPAFEMNQP